MRLIQPDADRLPELLNVLDGANLAVETEGLKSGIDAGGVYAAVSEPTGSTETTDGQMLGVLVIDGDQIIAIAVRRHRRDQGIGTALVEAVREDREGLVADFDEDARPFWESLDFDIESLAEPDRYRGIWSA